MELVCLVRSIQVCISVNIELFSLFLKTLTLAHSFSIKVSPFPKVCDNILQDTGVAVLAILLATHLGKKIRDVRSSKAPLVVGFNFCIKTYPLVCVKDLK